MSESESLRRYLEERLQGWAKWAIENQDKIGWASTSPIFALLMHGGINGGTFEAKTLYIDNPEAEEVERWLGMLWHVNHLQAEAIKLQYLGRYETLEELARKVKINLSTLKTRLSGAKSFLLGLCLGAKNDRYLQAV